MVPVISHDDEAICDRVCRMQSIVLFQRVKRKVIPSRSMCHLDCGQDMLLLEAKDVS